MNGTRWLFRAEWQGDHVHVGVWAGSPTQAEAKARPKVGTLIMDGGQWVDWLRLLEHGRPGVEIEYP